MPVAAVDIDLKTKGLTYDEMAAVSGLTKRGVMAWVKRNRDNIYVERFATDKTGREFIQVFRWSDLPKPPDAKRPGRQLTPAEQMRKYRANKKLKREL